MRKLTVFLAAGLLVTLCGCPEQPADTEDEKSGTPEQEATPDGGAEETAAVPGAPDVAFAVAWETHSNPARAAKKAAVDAIDKLGCPAKGLIFYEYYPKYVTVTETDAAGDEIEKQIDVPDLEKEKTVLPAIRSVASAMPVIGCRARALVAGGTMFENTVAVLAIGGNKLGCKAVKAELVDDRKAVGTAIAEGLKDVKDLKLVMVLSERRLGIEPSESISVDDFIRGVLDTTGPEVKLFGGNGMPNNFPEDKTGVQFIDDESLAGHVVAMGIGGPIAVQANHTNEFIPSEATVTVTKADGPWVYEFDGRPAPEVYREIRGMEPDDEFSRDWQHPIGLVVGQDKVCLRMVLEEDKRKDALKFVSAIPEGTEVKILLGGADPKAILDSAATAIKESLAEAGDATPKLLLLADSHARGDRLRMFGVGNECEVQRAILPALGEEQVPIFGFYAWGELGPIGSEFDGLPCMFQQHSFVCAVVTEEE